MMSSRIIFQKTDRLSLTGWYICKYMDVYNMKNYSDLLFFAVTFLPGLSGSHVFANTIFNAEYRPAGARD